MDQKYVWPRCGVITNLPVEVDKATGHKTCKSTSGLRDQLVDEGFSPRKVTAVWNSAGFSGFTLVEFKGDMPGYADAMNFERTFQLRNAGKRDWDRGIDSSDKRLYGWVARTEEYRSRDTVGSLLRKKGSLKSVSEFLAEEERKAELVARTFSYSIKRVRNLDEDNEPGKHQRRKL